MEHGVLHEALENLAERYIPTGRHKLLHVNSRRAWVNLMEDLLERRAVSRKLSILTKCAAGWELLLFQRISTQN